MPALRTQKTISTVSRFFPREASNETEESSTSGICCIAEGMRASDPGLSTSTSQSEVSSSIQKIQLSKSSLTPAFLPAGKKSFEDLSICEIYYPLTPVARASFRKQGKRITAHHWAVYDFTRKIPAGKVTTYKDVCLALGQGSPRSVGSALRNNPFAPYIPCHRIIASNLFIGGFYGEWGTGSQVNRKMEMLAAEGVRLTKDGYLDGKEYLWNRSGSAKP